MKTTKTLFLAGGLLLAALGSLPTFAAQSDDADLIARGDYLSKASDCAACHTRDDSAPFAGGLALETPLGQVFSTNITPSKSDGIGDYSLEDFTRALREGVRQDGANLYPAMPYTAYVKLTDADIKALYAYFMHGVEPVDAPSSQTQLPFPFNIRSSMIAWNWLFLDDQPFTPDPDKSDLWNRGAYLAQGPAHCSTCHTPRNALMAEKNDEYLGGASLGTWFAPNITSDSEAGIGDWSLGDIESYLATGQSSNGSQAGGPMLEAIDKSFRHLSDDDIKALATYIQSVPAQSTGAAPTPTRASAPAPTSDISLINGSASHGAQLYDMHCAACHQPSGQGANGLPALEGNAALIGRPTADNVVMAILDGLQPAEGQAMPAFGKELDDDDIAELTNHLFATYGNDQIQTTPARVTELRKGGAPSPLLHYAKIGMIVGGIVALLILAAIVWVIRRRRP